MRASNHPGSGNDDEEYENVLSVLIVDDDASRGGDGPPKRKRAGRVALGNRAALKRQVGLLRSQGRRQIGLRVCQTVSYVLAALCVLGGVIAIHISFTQFNKDMEQYSKMGARLAPAIPQATQTVRTINQALGPIVAAIGTIKDVTGGVTNVLQEVKDGVPAAQLNATLSNATDLVAGSIGNLSTAVADTITNLPDTINALASGNQTALQDAGRDFSRVGTSIANTAQQFGSDLLSAGQSLLGSLGIGR